jgi:hypothetical protein
MPADVDLFDMRRENVLEAMTLNELVGELERTYLMLAEVKRYQALIRKIRDARIKAG